MDANIKLPTERFILTELCGQIKLTEWIMSVCVCVYVCVCVCVWMCMRRHPFTLQLWCFLLLRGIYCVSRCFELQHTQCQQLPSNYRKPALRVCLWKTRQCFLFLFFHFFCFFVWSENDIIKYEWKIWSVPQCSVSARSRWCGKDNPSPDRGTQLGHWGPDGLLTTGNHSQHADTLTSTQMGYQNYPEYLGCCDSTLPCHSLGLFLSSLTPLLCSKSSELRKELKYEFLVTFYKILLFIL